MKLLRTILVLAVLVACATKAPPQPNDQAVLALGIKGATLVEPHLISTGQYDEAQFSRLPALGYRTVVQLRVATEEGTGWEESKARDLGLEFVRIPVDGAKGLTEENARKLDDALKNRKGGTLVACNSGNRVGGLFALRAHFCGGKPVEQALAEGRKAGLAKAEPDVRKVLGMPEAK
jgi:uncharacterized protein (TIGR01244 family)